jgi:2-polyprenyl-3-methyl-5-hydroxy-6-metoxy-1,4-benzoquinol methylase
MAAPSFAEPQPPFTSQAEPPAPGVSPDEPPAPALTLVGPPATPACPVCRGTSWSRRRWYTSLRDCGGCGTVLNDRAATRAEEEERYRTTGGPVEGQAVDPAESRWRFVVKTAGGTPHRVLDVGCGAGAFLEAARRSGAEVAGIEIDPSAANAARSRGVSVTIGSILGAVPLGYGWDVVTLWDVLDHLDDPAEALARLRARMKPGGLLVARGRNAILHAPMKRLSLLLRRVLPGFPDPAVVHRFGLRPEGWTRLLIQAGYEQVRPHPARFGGLRPSLVFTARAGQPAPPTPWDGGPGPAAA